MNVSNQESDPNIIEQFTNRQHMNIPQTKVSLMSIFNEKNNSQPVLKKNENISHNENNSDKCCIDIYNLNNCPCHKNKESFTMAQSVFPLHYPTLPAFSQILNENMANISGSFMKHTNADPLTRDYPSEETTTGFFNVIPKKL
jgi:hypothetical protein